MNDYTGCGKKKYHQYRSLSNLITFSMLKYLHLKKLCAAFIIWNNVALLYHTKFGKQNNPFFSVKYASTKHNSCLILMDVYSSILNKFNVDENKKYA